MASNKIFFCYSTIDRSIAEIIVEDLKTEKIELELCLDGVSPDEFEDKLSSLIDSSETVLFLVSDNSKTDVLSKMCIDYASNTNKNLIPVSYKKKGWLSGNSWIKKEWNIRREEVFFLDIDSKAELYSLMKELLGIPTEPGDRVGEVITITTTSNGSLYRDGQLLTKLTVGQPCSIRLSKRTHHLSVIGNIYDNDLVLTYDVKIKKNIGSSNWTIDLKQEEYNKHLEYVEKENHRLERISELKNDLRYAEIYKLYTIQSEIKKLESISYVDSKYLLE